MLSGVIWSRVQAGECDKSICALNRHTLQGIDQSGADDRADAGDRAHARKILFAIRTRFDQRLGPQVNARDELIEACS